MAELSFSNEQLVEITIYYILQLETSALKMKWEILVVCMGGMGTSMMIKNQVKQIIPNGYIENVPLSAASRLNMEKYDLVLSNGSISNIIGALGVQALLSGDNIQAIKQYLVYSKLNNRKIVSTYIKQPENSIMFSESNLDLTKEEYLKHILKDFLDSKIINDDNYIFEKLARREKSGIGVPNTRVALFHTSSSSINRPVIHIAQSKRFSTIGLDSSDMECDIILMILLPDVHVRKVLESINYLSQLLIFDDKLIKIIYNRDIKALEQIIINKY